MTFRKVALKIHLWLGLSSGLIVLILALSGCILSFEKEIKLKLYPERYFVNTVEKEKLPLSDLKIMAQQAMPEKQSISRVEITADPKRTYIFRALKIDDNALTFWGAYKYYYRVYINPYNGKVIEVENVKQDFFEIVLNLHRRLLLGEKVGKYITGYTTLFFLISLLTGLVIWVPRKVNKNTIKGMFKIKITSNLKRLNYDLHNVLGFYSVVPLILISYSALIWSFKDVDQLIQKLLNGNEHTKEKPRSIPVDDPTDSKKITNIVWSIVEKNLADKNSALINFPKTEEDTYYAEITYANKQYQNDHYNFDQYSGKILKSQFYQDKNTGAGTALRERNYDLHTGTIIGTGGRIIYFIASIIAFSLPVSGLIIYLNKGKKKKQPKKK
ncbi:PepSY-associated TM helix domain-containing protein [Elizabethkingia miricola]|uniref:PepSY-associated TM helix domain-containing protein n=1 Tax=Elizabethkingia miricola TaxID=172045 RepID=UPI00099AB709|nr:PepSY-associated TM helix domain-containing protein [Elizabethkingia miricola]OPC32594.1 peptidase [Elizabethkingia miricola]